jgi:hypothetical protein
MPSQVAFDPTQIVAFTGDIFPQAGIGERFEHKNGNTYRYGLFHSGVGAVAAVAGNCVYLRNGVPPTFQFTSDYSDSIMGAVAELSGVVGILLCALVSGRYGWIQTRGYHPLVHMSGAGSAGQILVPSTTDGILTTVITGSVTAAQAGGQRVGTQYAASVAGFGPAMLELVL